jgi:hypothetical protein
LIKIIDIIQELREKQKDIPTKQFSLEDLLIKFDKEMDSHEKDLVRQVLKDLKWIK